MSRVVKVTRRDFLRQTGVGAGALVLGCHLSGGDVLLAEAPAGTTWLNNFLAIGPDGAVTLIAHRSEMGQGIRSSLPAVLADELEADWSRVTLRQADADHSKYGVGNPIPGGQPAVLVNGADAQFTDSSRSMAAYFQPMRLFGATARLMLIAAAAQKLGVDAGELEARQHEVHHAASGRSLGYGELAASAARQPVPGPAEVQAALKQPEQWCYITKKMPFFDADDMVTGRAVYGADVVLPGMLTAMVVHCPVANGDVRSFDATEALKVPGVKAVVEVLPPVPFPRGGVGGGFMPHAGIAVVAENTWAAWKGRRALKVEWELGLNAAYESAAYRKELEASTAQQGRVQRSKGDVDTASGETVEADYYTPHLAQAPMEPPAAVARYDNGSWEVWSPTQGPQITQQYVGLAMLYRDNPLEWLEWEEREDIRQNVREHVTIHVTLLGGGFGRKSKPDYAVEAAFLAEKFPGVPIRVQWTREDDVKFSYYQGVSHQHLRGTLDAEGRATSWLQRSAFPSFFATLFPPPFPFLPEPARQAFAAARAAFHNGGEYPYASAIERAHGLEDMPFDVPNLRIENCKAQSHIRGGWMRSVANIHHAFAIGSFADELAVAAGRDSKDYLLELIGPGRQIDLAAEGVEAFDNNQFPTVPVGVPVPVLPGYPVDTARLRGVVERVAEASGWDRKIGNLPPGRGLGIAAHRSFLTYVALVFDVELNEVDELTIHEVHGAIDCGVPVNPDRIIAQMEGGIVYGLSLALLGEITVKGGAVEQNNFDDYPVLRLYQTPRKIVTHLVPSQEPPTGVGEPPVPPVAPALCNAIVNAGGPRIRELPLYKFLEIV